MIYKHDLTKEEAQQLPKILRGRKPDEINEFGQYVYVIKNQNGQDLRIVLSTEGNNRIVASMYRVDR